MESRGNMTINHSKRMFLRPVSAFLLGCASGASVFVDGPANHEFLQRHCIHCHEDGNNEGGLDLVSLRVDSDDPLNLARWAKVYDLIVAGEMPPADEPRPNEKAAAEFTRITSDALQPSWEKRYATHGRAGGRRLNPVGSRQEVEAQVAKLRHGRSILDSVGERARQFENRVGTRLARNSTNSIRAFADLEKRLHKSEQWEQQPKTKVAMQPPQDYDDPGALIERARTP